MANTFGVAPPASAQKPPTVKKPIPSRMPLEIGKAVKVKKLSPEEEKKLLEIGWQQGQAIPENLTDLMEQVKSIQTEALDVNNMPPPVPLDTPPLVYDANKEVDVSNLPPAEQAKYKAIMKQIFDDAQKQDEEAKRVAASLPAGAGEGVAESIRKAMSSSSDIEIEDDTADLPAAEAQAKEAEPGKTHCIRCGFPLAQPDVVVVTDEDRDLYLQAADSLQLFTKDYEYAGGAVKVTIRELMHQEQELLYQQMVLDHQMKRVVGTDDLRQMQMRYAMNLQIPVVQSKHKRIERPETLTAWKEKLNTETFEEMAPGDTLLRKIYLWVLKEDMPESVFAFMFRTWFDFDILHSKLQAQSQQPDFWKPRTEDS